MSYMNWETALVTKAINKTIARKPKSPKRKNLKQKHRQDNNAAHSEQH